MPEISLKEYFAKLNHRLTDNAADEVIHHCRHILQFYPKNVTAYRLLGRALVVNGRWDEGREALRRVLSVIPDDYTAHLGLSEANERMDRADEAIWHLERALEQRPNDKDLIEALRGLYRRYRHVENLKIQLTAVAVARQNLRGGNYAQAIDTLRSALSRMNDRLDLKLLLAQILWQKGSEEESAEIALEVLKVLPDCLEANKIMAKLWLSVDRPSDAQRYVNHLESVDPYLAVELVQGSPPDDDVFRIDELDYVRSSQSEMTSDRPDWLQEISTTPTSTAEVAKAAAGDDWTNWSSAMLKKPPTGPLKDAAPPVNKPADKSTSARFAAMKKDEPVNSGGLTDLFGKPDEADSEELSSLFSGNQSDKDEDPMAWLRDAGVEVVVEEDQQPSYESLFAEEEDGPLPEMDENPLAWLQGNDVELESDQPASANEDDTPSWLYGNSGSAFEDAEPAVANSADSLDWLQDDQLLDDALGMDSLNVDSADATLVQMRAPSRETNKMPNPSSDNVGDEPPAPAPRRGLTAMLQETNFDWVNKQQDDQQVTSDDEMDDWLNQFGPSEPRKSVTETPDWLTDLEQPETTSPEKDEWFAPEETESAAQPPVAASEEFAWMSDNTIEEDPGDEDSDWLAEFKPDEAEKEQPAEGDDFAWMAGGTAEEASTEEAPDWLSELNPEADEAQPALSVAPASALSWLGDNALTDATPEAEPEAATDEVPDWLSELEPEQSETQSVPTAADETTLDTEFSWLTDDALADSETEVAAVASDAPDWLSELEAVGAGSEPLAAVSDSDSEFTWMNDDSPTAEAEPAISDSEFTWMSEEALATPEAEPEAVTADDIDWLAQLEPEQLSSEPEAEAQAVASDVPDWLSELEPEEAASAPEPEVEPAAVSDTEFTWMSEEPAAESESEVVASDVPDWLSELEPEQPVSTSEPEAVSAVSNGEFTWMTEEALANAESESSAGASEFTWMNTEPDAEAEPEAVGIEEPDWLSELEPEQEASVSEPEAEPEAVAADDLDWLSELEPEQEASASEPELAGIEEPDWLSELKPEAESASEQPETEPVAAAAEDADWLSELQPEGETVPSAEAEAGASNDLDWLSELEPETPEFEPEAMAADISSEDTATDEDFDWLNEPETVADAEEAPLSAGVTDTQQLEAITMSEDADASEDTAFDGTEVDESEGEFATASVLGDEPHETTPAHNAPDWLNAMVPGLDVDYEATEDEVPEDEAEEPEPETSKREYAWLVDMVEEENVATDRPRFVFSRPPTWLEQPVNGLSHPQQGEVDDDLPDWPSDDADADVPEWLR